MSVFSRKIKYFIFHARVSIFWQKCTNGILDGRNDDFCESSYQKKKKRRFFDPREIKRIRAATVDKQLVRFGSPPIVLNIFKFIEYGLPRGTN